MIYGNAEMDKYILSIPDFPVEGIIFRDVTTVLRDADGLHLAISELDKLLEGVEYDAIVGLESRGFIFGTPLAYNNHKPFILVRKKGKLPRDVVSVKYELEYGFEEVEMHKEDIKPGMKIAIVDDLLATGGTMKAAAELVEKLGGEVTAMLVLIELCGLNGRENLKDYNVKSVIGYEGK